MKKYGLMIISFALVLTAIPMAPALISRNSTSAPNAAPPSPTDSPETDSTDINETILMLDVSTGDVLTLSMKDYIIGAVTAEMPASFEKEALKAQAVAVHTYAVRQQQAESENPTPELCGAALSNDSDHYQAYFTKSQAMEFYGTGYENAYKKISAAAEEVLPYIITYDDEPILAAFCSMSSGQTESAANVWGQEVPYLVPADSDGDKNAPNYLWENEFSKKELKKLLESAFPDGDFSSSGEEFLKVEKCSESGTVLSAVAGGVKVSGQDIRSALSLRSAAFDVDWDGDVCKITTKGYGHGVGMSQYGANAMAKSGANWKEILQHYYTDAEICKVK